MKSKVLLLAGGGLHDHESVASESRDILTTAGLDVDLRLDDTTILRDLPKLEARAVIIYHTLGNIEKADLWGLADWVGDGHGFVGLHSAADSFKDEPVFRALIGGRFLRHPSPRPYVVSTVGDAHEITAGLEDFEVHDEQYVMEYDPANVVVAKALYQGEVTPVAWCRHWGAGRVYYLALGHDARATHCEGYRQLLIRGCYWCMQADAITVLGNGQ